MTGIRKSRVADYDAVAEQLRSASLPVAGVAEHFRHYLVAVDGSEIVGAIGLEVYDDVALLRSTLVKTSEQNKGIGSKLFDALLENAKSVGIQRLILLTNTAEQYFARKGFKKIDQKSVAGPITTSVEFSGACPSHAACMELVF